MAAEAQYHVHLIDHNGEPCGDLLGYPPPPVHKRWHIHFFVYRPIFQAIELPYVELHLFIRSPPEYVGAPHSIWKVIHNVQCLPILPGYTTEGT